MLLEFVRVARARSKIDAWSDFFVHRTGNLRPKTDSGAGKSPTEHGLTRRTISDRKRRTISVRQRTLALHTEPHDGQSPSENGTLVRESFRVTGRTLRPNTNSGAGKSPRLTGRTRRGKVSDRTRSHTTDNLRPKTDSGAHGMTRRTISDRKRTLAKVSIRTRTHRTDNLRPKTVRGAGKSPSEHGLTQRTISDRKRTLARESLRRNTDSHDRQSPTESGLR